MLLDCELRGAESLGVIVGGNPGYADAEDSLAEAVHLNVSTIFWEAEHKDLASLGGVFAKITSDQGYSAVVSKANGLFIEGSLHDSLMGSV